MGRFYREKYQYPAICLELWYCLHVRTQESQQSQPAFSAFRPVLLVVRPRGSRWATTAHTQVQ